MKRIISLMLSLIIILSLVSGAAISVSAASNMSTSTMGINMIKSFEGFSKWPHEDNGQWTVGYGTGVTGSKLDKYNQYGITESEATELLAEYLESFEASVNNFIDTHNLKLSQSQFDALVSFTYNLGSSWMSDTSSTFRAAVINGKTGNDFIFAMAQFGKASGNVVGGLVQRRLCEAHLYLNGAYTNTPPANFKYVEYKANIAGAIPTVSIQGYDTTKSVAPKATISKDGYRFMGWYSKETGGDWITSLGSGTASVAKLYAHWQEGDGPKNTDGSIKGTALSLTGYMPASADHNVYDAPNGTKKSTVKGDTKLSVTAEYVDSNGKKWGKTSSGWIVISGGLSATPVYEEAGSAIEPMTVTVTTGNVNNRVGPGTNYAKQGTYSKGQKLTLTAVQKGGNYTWGKSEQGWIALQYTDYETSKVTNSEDAKKVTAIGTVYRSNYVNVRAGAGTSHAKVGVYYRNDEVKISLRQKVGNTTWGLTEKGWVSLYYVKLTEVEAGSVEDMNFSTGSTGGTTTDTTVNGGTPTTGGNTVVATGKVYNCKTLRIRSAAGTSNAHIGDYAAGTIVNIYETISAKSEVWGRTDRGWISMRYVKLDAPTTGVGVTGRVYRTTSVNVRSGAGTHFPKVGSLKKDTKVEIVEYIKVGNATWGRTHEGWVSLYYISLDAPLSNLDKTIESAPVTPEASEPEVTEPAATKYTITVNSATNGSVAASATSAEEGAEITLTITPNANYVLDTLSVKNASGATIAVTNNKFTMPEGNVTVTATFKAQYDVIINAAEGGKVTANTTACDAGAKVMLTVSPNEGYALKTLTYVNTATNAVTELYNDATSEYIKNSFTMPAADVNVVATFKQSKGATYTVKANSAVNGEVAANVSAAKAGDKVIVVLNPATDYTLNTLSIRTSANKVVEYTEVDKNTVAFEMPKANVTISATFKREAFDVNIANATGGTVSIAEPGTYKKGETVTLTVAPKAEYKFKSLSVKAGSTVIETKNSGTTYTFTMPAANVDVKATFEKIVYDLSFVNAENGTVSAAEKAYAKGDDVELKIEPATGYELDKLTVKDSAGKELTVTDNKFEMPSGGAIVSATFKKVVYKVNFELYENNVKIDPIDGVHMSASKTDAVMGETITLNVYGDTGYTVTFKSIMDGNNKAIELDGGKFTMPAANVTVAVNVVKIPYDVVIKNPNVGKVSLKVNRQYTVGETVELIVTDGQVGYTKYVLDELTVKDAKGNAVEVNNNKFTMPASNVEITPTFKAAHNIILPVHVQNGSVTTEKTYALQGDKVVLKVTPNSGYVADSVIVKNGKNNVSVEKTDAGYEFTMPNASVTVEVSFVRVYNITIANNIKNGTVTVDKTTAKAGETVTVTVSPADGYRLQYNGLSVNNGSVHVSAVSGKMNTYTFKMPNNNATVSATFVPFWM